MDITTKVIELHPLHQISELFINDSNERFCYVLEDIQRPHGHKVKRWTSLPRTGMTTWYNVGIRHSPSFGREMLSISNEPDGVTVRLGGVEFTYPMLHSGNDNTNTEGCPLVAYEKIDRFVELDYNGKKIEFQESIIYRQAETDLFNLVAPEIRKGEEVRLFMLGLND